MKKIIIISIILLFCTNLFAQPKNFSEVKKELLRDNASFECFQTHVMIYTLEKKYVISRGEFWKYNSLSFNGLNPLPRLIRDDVMDSICQKILYHEIRPLLKNIVTSSKQRVWYDKHIFQITLKFLQSKKIKKYYRLMVENYNNYIGSDGDSEYYLEIQEKYFNDYLNNYYIIIETD